MGHAARKCAGSGHPQGGTSCAEGTPADGDTARHQDEKDDNRGSAGRRSSLSDFSSWWRAVTTHPTTSSVAGCVLTLRTATRRPSPRFASRTSLLRKLAADPRLAKQVGRRRRRGGGLQPAGLEGVRSTPRKSPSRRRRGRGAAEQGEDKQKEAQPRAGHAPCLTPRAGGSSLPSLPRLRSVERLGGQRVVEAGRRQRSSLRRGRRRRGETGRRLEAESYPW